MKAPLYPHARVQSIDSLRHPLGMEPDALRNLSARASRMYFVAKRVIKEDGSERVLYDTRQPLKSVLQRINEQFLRRVRYPEYLTGGVPGKDYKSSVDIHANAATVIKEDITKFYPSVSAAVVFDIWHRFFGFSAEVAELLAQLTTRDGHLEQGAPTSGYLANLALWDVEPSMVQRLAERGIDRYSRHVDDICISSERKLGGQEIAWAVSQVYGMLRQKELQAKRSKHKVMRSHAAITILKLVGNTKASLPSSERSRVRAMVHRFCKAGAEATAEEHVQQLLAELPRVRGQAYKVKRFHVTEGTRLAAKIDEVARLLVTRRDSSVSSSWQLGPRRIIDACSES
ncbi:reverse transcriptase family protein [Cupriavidus basilensis]|uniref:reverse transcriptase family protein n=1 Tax=Cupriavidus basilensis TaxID=68895 RepID=UPI0020A6B902|nr:reverse transcriptase family protein [Cupriavidus basilensis]MCP3019631.1 reverse transcriptase family protein [Cupriavidus basilensis]